MLGVFSNERMKDTKLSLNILGVFSNERMKDTKLSLNMLDVFSNERMKDMKDTKLSCINQLFTVFKSL